MKDLVEMVNNVRLAFYNYFYRKEVEKEKLKEAEEMLEQAHASIKLLRETLVKLYDGSRTDSSTDN